MAKFSQHWRAAASLLAVLVVGIVIGAAVSGHGNTAQRTSTQSTPTSQPTSTSGVAGAGTTCPATVSMVVNSSSELHSALASVKPGGSIALASGTYSGNFVTHTSGTQTQPITLCGPRTAVIDGGKTTTGYALYLDGASWWTVSGFTLQNAQKGVVTDRSDNVTLDSLYVHSIGDEAVHLRTFSSYDIVESLLIRDTGLHSHKYGEGIYIGSAKSNWCTYTSCQPDTSDHDVIRNNDISQTTAENVDIKEGTTGGTVTGNHFNGTGMDPSSATGWVNAKGNDWTISDNTGTNSPKDGYQVHQVASGWGEGNIFHGNQADVNGPGYGIYVQSKSLGTVVGCDNTTQNAGSGSSNEECT